MPQTVNRPLLVVGAVAAVIVIAVLAFVLGSRSGGNGVPADGSEGGP
jgi:hypothetical protein